MSKSDEQIEQQDKRRAASAAHKALPQGSFGQMGTADWANADSAIVLQLVCNVGERGGAVRFGYTRDGGAYSIGIYMGDQSKTYYCNEKDGVNETLKELADYFAK